MPNEAKDVLNTVHNHVNKIYWKHVENLHKNSEGNLEIKGEHLIGMLDEAFKKGQDNPESKR